MSYILDALKKSQAAQSPDAIALNQQVTPKPRLLIHVLLTIALSANVVFFSFFWPLNSYDSDVSPEPVVVEALKRQPTPMLTPATEDPATSTAQAAVPAPVIPPETSSRPTQAPARQSQPIMTVRVDTLTATERVLYEGFNFTSHIYTRAQNLRAIVIDGQRVEIGDSFKGLKIHDITETGVIFEEIRRGEQRRVAVNPFE